MLRISTESEFGSKRRKKIVVASFIFAAFAFSFIVSGLIVIWASIKDGHLIQCFPAIYSLTFLISALLILLALPGKRGTWELDSEGISFHSLKGIKSRLNWTHVNAVRFAGARILFRGLSNMPPLPLLYIEEVEKKTEILQFVRERISSSIDLSDKVEKPFTWRRFLFCLTLSLLLGGLPSGIIYSQAISLLPGSKWISLEILALMISLLALAVFGFWKQDLKQWHVKRDEI